MPEISITISEKTFRKIKTVAMLTGSNDIEPLIVDHLDAALSRQIVSVLGLDELSSSSPTFGYTAPIAGVSSDSIPEEEEVGTPKKPSLPANTTHVLSKKDIELDDSVADPKHEAVSGYDDSTTFEELMGPAGGVSSEDIDDSEDGDDSPFDFSDIVEIDEDAPPPRRIGAKPLPKGFRGRIGEYNGNNPVNPERD